VTDARALLVVAAAVLVAGVARRLGWPAPLVLVAVGLAGSLVPGVQPVSISPDLVMTVVLPPLVYAAALSSSYLSIRANLRPIAVLSVGLVLFTTLVVGWVGSAVVPGVPIAAAMVLGAVVSPTDAVAATAVGRTLGLPRRLLTILGGESLLNDGTGLTLYQVAVAAVVGTSLGFVGVVGELVLVSAGGVLVGLVIAYAVRWVLVRTEDSVLENTILLLVPFATFGIADALHVSGILAVVVAGLSIGHHASRILTYGARLQSEAVWRVIEFLLESVVFLVIGLQLRHVVQEVLPDAGVADLLLWAVVVLGTVMVSRFVWLYATAYLARLVPAVRRREPAPSPGGLFVVSWAGMRGVVSLAAAQALPLTTTAGGAFPGRDLIVFLTFVVVVGTLLLEGSTLPWVVRRAGLADEAADDAQAEAEAQRVATDAAVRRLDDVLATETDVPDHVVTRLRARTSGRVVTARERAENADNDGDEEPPTVLYRRLRREMLAAEREAFAQLRDEGQLDDEVMRRVHRELDLEEAMLARD
jgi:monovalent cation/hydrogen antiporter